MRGRRLLVALASTASLAAAGCRSGGGSGEDVASADLALGRAVYAAKCASCHGADLRGTPQGPSHLSRVYERSHHGDFAFRSAVLNGARAHHWRFGDMPPVEGLSVADVDAVIAYIRSEQAARGLEPYPPG